MYEQMIENWAEARIHILTSWSRVKMERLHFNARDHVIADPDVFLNADPEPGAFSMRIRIKVKIYLTISVVYLKNLKRLLKRKNHGAGPNLLIKNCNFVTKNHN